MALEDVLHQGEPETGSALGAAFDDVDPIEPFGQSRQVLRGDAGAFV